MKHTEKLSPGIVERRCIKTKDVGIIKNGKFIKRGTNGIKRKE